MKIQKTRSLAAMWLALSAVPCQASVAVPPLPYLSKGAPGECTVVHGPLWATKATRAYLKPRRLSAVAFTIKERERVMGVESNVYTLKYGILRVATTSVDLVHTTWDPHAKDWVEIRCPVKRGDIAYLLYSIGEGSYEAWVNGKVVSTSPEKVGKTRYARLPKIEWWQQVRNKKGQIGWVWMDKAAYFEGSDKCAGELPSWAK